MTEGFSRGERAVTPEQQRNKRIQRILALTGTLLFGGGLFLSEGRPSSSAPEGNTDPSGEVTPPDSIPESPAKPTSEDATQKLTEQLHAASPEELGQIEAGLEALAKIRERMGEGSLVDKEREQLQASGWVTRPIDNERFGIRRDEGRVTEYRVKKEQRKEGVIYYLGVAYKIPDMSDVIIQEEYDNLDELTEAINTFHDEYVHVTDAYSQYLAGEIDREEYITTVKDFSEELGV